jgi:serine/threonine-protein kinase HipA
VNLALGNKDNHARNTAVQRDFNGHIALTPLYDFAPMYLHPDGIARRIRWEGNDAGQPDWARVIDRVCELSTQVPIKQRKKGVALLERAPLVAGLKAMVPALELIAAEGESMGLEPEVFSHLRQYLLARAQELTALG